MKKVLYWVMGGAGFIVYGVNCVSEWVAGKSNTIMDFISDNTDHAHEEFRFPEKQSTRT